MSARRRDSFFLGPAGSWKKGKGRGFTLVEVLVALAVFAVMAAIAYGALIAIARSRTALAAQQDRFAAVVRAMSDMERDLRQTIARPVLDNYGATLPALIGTADRIELTRLGFANPQAEPRSNLERVSYAFGDRKLLRGHYPVLDRAPGTTADARTLLDRIDSLRLRYLAADGTWSETWPLRGMQPQTLPRAVEFRLALADYGELRRVLELPRTLPSQAPEALDATGASGGGATPSDAGSGGP